MLTLLGLSAKDFVSAQFVGNDESVVSVRFKTHKAAATLVNIVNSGGMPPEIPMRARWADPNAENLIQAILDGGNSAPGS